MLGKGGEGGIDMAKRVVELVEGSEPTPKFVYELTDSIEDKIGKIVRTIYGGDGVTFGAKAKKQIAQLKEWGLIIYLFVWQKRNIPCPITQLY